MDDAPPCSVSLVASFSAPVDTLLRRSVSEFAHFGGVLSGLASSTAHSLEILKEDD